MDGPHRVLLFLALVMGTMIVVPAVAWIVWWRRIKPRPWPLLVLALVVTAPLVTAVGGAIAISAVMRSSSAQNGVDPSQKARLLAEAISAVMNVTALVAIATIVIAGAFIIARMIRRRLGR